MAENGASPYLPNTPSQKSKERILGFLGGTQGRIRARIISISRALGAEKPATKRPRSYMEGPRGGKASCKTSKKMYMEGSFPQLNPSRRGEGARAPPCSRGVPSARAGFFLYIYIYLSIPLYNIYPYIYLSLSLFFEQVKLLEKA